MPIVQNLMGRVFGRLRVIGELGRDRRSRRRWLCLCSCGKQKAINSRHLVNMKTSSCGCLRDEASRRNGVTGARKISGAKSHLYKPWLTDADRMFDRNFLEMRELRKAVLSRDNYTCGVCSVRGGKMVAHHVFSWHDNKLLRFETSNGETLCRNCHLMFHLWNGGPRKPCNRSQYDDFLCNIPRVRICLCWRRRHTRGEEEMKRSEVCEHGRFGRDDIDSPVICRECGKDITNWIGHHDQGCCCDDDCECPYMSSGNGSGREVEG